MKKKSYLIALGLIVVALICSRTCGRGREKSEGKSGGKGAKKSPAAAAAPSLEKEPASLEKGPSSLEKEPSSLEDEAPSLEEEVKILKKTSRAFSAVAKKAIPAVVFIQVEKTIAARGYGGRRHYNDPFEYFGEDFFERFFGRGHARPPMRYKQRGQGSGFIISKDGYILTNNHVVGDADKIIVKMNDGRELSGKLIGSDPKSEVAVIKVEAEDLPVLELGDSARLEIGEWVIAVGNPFGLAETLTVGVVSAKGRSNLNIAEYEDFIQTDAAINPGNSGGPLLDIDGRVVGINTAIFSQSGGYMGIGFAIPINMAKSIKNQLVAGGKVVRGFLGVKLNRQEVDADMAKTFGLSEAGGVLIAELVKGSPAEGAGIKAGDIITKVNGEKVSDNSSFRNKVAMLEPGSTVGFTVFRDGREETIEVKIGTFPDGEALISGTSEASVKLGITVLDLTAEIAKRLGYEFQGGVIVSDVEDGSEAQRHGIQRGHLILSVNRTPVRNAAEYNAAVAKAAKGGRVLMRVKGRYGSWFVLLRTKE